MSLETYKHILPCQSATQMRNRNSTKTLKKKKKNWLSRWGASIILNTPEAEARRLLESRSLNRWMSQDRARMEVMWGALPRQSRLHFRLFQITHYNWLLMFTRLHRKICFCHMRPASHMQFAPVTAHITYVTLYLFTYLFIFILWCCGLNVGLRHDSWESPFTTVLCPCLLTKSSLF